ncbi:MAG: DNA replication and repair protein RecF [Oligoflexia bacterium]|nr:DNA replication and repair protein RecF [Oligoflexia bacterium]
MVVDQIQLRNFRNLRDIHLCFSPKLNLIFGDNGQGKTSLVEALHFVSGFRSFRGAKLTDLITKNEHQALIDLKLKEGDQDIWVRLHLFEHSKKLWINEKLTPPGKFRGKMRCIVFSPDSIAAIKYGPELRRELVDEACAQIWDEAKDTLHDFQRALKQRNALLRQIKEGLIDAQNGQRLLEAIDEVYVNKSAEIIHFRLRLLTDLQPQIQEILHQLHRPSEATFAFQYMSQERPWMELDLKAVHGRIEAEIKDMERRAIEVHMGTTITGPHRHDIKLLFNGNDSRIFCSQGQQRGLILAFKIAEIMYHRTTFGSYPLLVLDDVLSEFDEKKRRYLINFLSSCEAQTFLTSTDSESSLIGGSRFELSAGRVNDGNSN